MVSKGIKRKERSDTVGSTSSIFSHASSSTNSSDSMASPSDSIPRTSDGEDDDETASQESKKIPRGSHACIICRRLKMRCVTDHPPGGGLPTGPCVRCARLGNDCVFQESRRGKRVRKDAKIEAMTKRMRMMEERIAQLQRHSASPATMLSPPIPVETSTEVFPINTMPTSQEWNSMAARRVNTALKMPTTYHDSACSVNDLNAFVEPDLVAEVEGLLANIQSQSHKIPASQDSHRPPGPSNGAITPHHMAHPQHHPYHFGPSGVQSPLHISTPPHLHTAYHTSHIAPGLPTPPDDSPSTSAENEVDEVLSLALSSLPSPPPTSHGSLLHTDADDLFWDDCFLSINNGGGGAKGGAHGGQAQHEHGGLYDTSSTTTTALNTPAITSHLAPNAGFSFFQNAGAVSPRR